MWIRRCYGAALIARNLPMLMQRYTTASPLSVVDRWEIKSVLGRRLQFYAWSTEVALGDGFVSGTSLELMRIW